MVFSSLLFLFIFLVLVLGIYFLLPTRARNMFLLIVSLLFYAWGEPGYVFVMIFSIVLNYVAGLCIAGAKTLKSKKAYLIIFVFLDIAILFFFKYTAFLFENVSSLFNIPLPFESFFDNIVLPIGISFYTFQMMSYVIDVWRGVCEVQKSIIDFGCYVALFPQLIAGPIVQYKTVAEQLKGRTHSAEKVSDGIVRFVTGLAKKVLLANQAGAVWERVFEMETVSALGALIGAIAFTFQIYFDFSGYSDMAIGLGKIFGFEFLENFNYPYIAKSATDFWRRWHISLSSWFRDYVYIPLGGNRRGQLFQLRNLALVWLLTGLWHGASWNFVLWGAFWGTLIILEKLFLLKILDKIPAIFAHLWTLVCAVFSWIIFACDDFSKLGAYLRALFGQNGLWDDTSIWLLSNYFLLFVLCALFSTPLFKKIWQRIENTPISVFVRVSGVVLLFSLSLIYIVSSTYNPFIYFRF